MLLKFIKLKGNLEDGKLFAQNSIGLSGTISYIKNKNNIIVKTQIKNPVKPALGMQMATNIGNMLISGPARLIMKKPRFIFKKFNWKPENKTKTIACIEGDIDKKKLIENLKKYNIKEILIYNLPCSCIGQIINICSRAIETAILRMFLIDSDFSISTGKSICKMPLPAKRDILCYANDCIRFNSEVFLYGNFKENSLDNYKKTITKYSKFKNKKFSDILKTCGSLCKTDIEAFSVMKLELINK